MKKIVKEFKEFISKGNVVDMAIGVIIGTAFGKIVSSLVSDVVMPLIGIILGGLDFTNITLKVGDSVIYFGVFIQNVVDFLIIAVCVFFFVKLINMLKNHKKKEEETTEVAAKDPEIELLEEIRDLLKESKKKVK